MSALGLLAAVVSPQVSSPVGLATPASMCRNVWGRGGSEVLESQGGGETRAALTPGSQGLAILVFQGLGCCPHNGGSTQDRKLVGNSPKMTKASHFLWTWTLAYSEKEGSGLGAGCLGARLRWTMSRSA